VSKLYLSISEAERALGTGLYFPGFPVPVSPGIPAFLHFPFPGENGRESRKIKYGSFYLISTPNFVLFQICMSLIQFFMMIAKISYTHISDEFENTFRGNIFPGK
jgi:hypothetical protein